MLPEAALNQLLGRICGRGCAAARTCMRYRAGTVSQMNPSAISPMKRIFNFALSKGSQQVLIKKLLPAPSQLYLCSPPELCKNFCSVAFLVSCCYPLHTGTFTLAGPKEPYFLSGWRLPYCSATWEGPCLQLLAVRL